MTDSPTCPGCLRPMTMEDMQFLLVTASANDIDAVEIITGLRETVGLGRGDPLPEVIMRADLIIKVLRERIKSLEGPDA